MFCLNCADHCGCCCYTSLTVADTSSADTAATISATTDLANDVAASTATIAGADAACFTN